MESENVLCILSNHISDNRKWVFVCQCVIGAFLCVFPTVALYRLYQLNKSSKLLLSFLCALTANLCVFITMAFSDVMFTWFYDWLTSVHNVVFFIAMAASHGSQFNVLWIFMFLAIQRFLLWKKPLYFMRQSNRRVVLSLVLPIILTYVIFAAVYLISLAFEEYEYIFLFWLAVQAFFTLLSIVAIVLQIYIACKASDLSETVYRRKSKVSYQHQGTAGVSIISQGENEGEAGGDSEGPSNNRVLNRGTTETEAVAQLLKNLMVMSFVMICILLLDSWIFNYFFNIDMDYCVARFLWDFGSLFLPVRSWLYPFSVFVSCRAVRQQLICRAPQNTHIL